MALKRSPITPGTKYEVNLVPTVFPQGKGHGNEAGFQVVIGVILVILAPGLRGLGLAEVDSGNSSMT